MNIELREAIDCVKRVKAENALLKQLLATLGIDEAAIQTAIRRMNNDR
jgi:DNA-binding transcriptional regulator PaaX